MAQHRTDPPPPATACPSCGGSIDPATGAALDLDGLTRPFPPLADTTRRRPPVPVAEPLHGAELLEAMAAELQREASQLRDQQP